MIILIIAIIAGFLTGRLLGYINNKNTNWVDGKQEVNDHMTKNYGEEWTKLN
jgi:hypothetical protein